jgi:hypothetical protein
MTKQELIDKLSEGDYKLSFSALSAFAVSPRNFIAYKLQERAPTKAMILGEALHVAILQPHLFNILYVSGPEVDATTKEGKKAWLDFLAQHTGIEAEKMTVAEIKQKVKEASKVTILEKAAIEELKRKQDAVLNNFVCKSFLDRLEVAEVDIPEVIINDITFRGRVDGLGDDFIIDLKNVPNAQIKRAENEIRGRRLHWQGFIYSYAYDMMKAPYILAVDDDGETSVHKFSNYQLDEAERQIMKLTDAFKRRCFEGSFDPRVWDSSQDFWTPDGINLIL